MDDSYLDISFIIIHHTVQPSVYGPCFIIEKKWNWSPHVISYISHMDLGTERQSPLVKIHFSHFLIQFSILYPKLYQPKQPRDLAQVNRQSLTNQEQFKRT